MCTFHVITEQGEARGLHSLKWRATPRRMLKRVLTTPCSVSASGPPFVQHISGVIAHPSLFVSSCLRTQPFARIIAVDKRIAVDFAKEKRKTSAQMRDRDGGRGRDRGGRYGIHEIHENIGTISE